MRTSSRLPPTFFFLAQQSHSGLDSVILETARSHTDTTLSMTPLYEGSTGCKDLHPTIHNNRKRQVSMPPAVFEPVIPSTERPQTHALDRAAGQIGSVYIRLFKIHHFILTYRNISHYVLPEHSTVSIMRHLKPLYIKIFRFVILIKHYATYSLKFSHLTPCRVKTFRTSHRCPQTTACQRRHLCYSRAPYEK
jgi:hypothetical protein